MITIINQTSIHICPCCSGSKIQTRNDGIRILCPACNGRGYIETYAGPFIPNYPDPWYVPTTPIYPTTPWITYSS